MTTGRRLGAFVGFKVEGLALLVVEGAGEGAAVVGRDGEDV